ncbi:MAG: FdrA family protein [Angustibacter sp.]
MTTGPADRRPDGPADRRIDDAADRQEDAAERRPDDVVDPRSDPAGRRPDDLVERRPGAYHDSVTLLQATQAVREVDGVLAAQVAMGTTLNLELMTADGFVVPHGAGPDDLVVAVRAADGAAVARALAALDRTLAAPGSADAAPGVSAVAPPRTVGAALHDRPAPVVVVSVPGPYAALEAWDAVRAGSSVLVFSDNVPVADEVALKSAAARRGVLVMGPDCGTAVLDGVGLGFANVVPPGPVSVVAASGTGAQQVMALLAHAGVGIRHCLGTGGRDLSAAVGGRSAQQALAALADDPGTEVIVMVGKPAAPPVLEALRRRCSTIDKPVIWATLGPGLPDLTASAEQVLHRLGCPVPTWPSWPPTPVPQPDPSADHDPAPRLDPARRSNPSARLERGAGPSPTPPPRHTGGLLRGLFCGGTLCAEAGLVAGEVLGRVLSNVTQPRLLLDGAGRWDAGAEHAVVDYGDDQLTVGRAHPMVDPRQRDERLLIEAADPKVGAVLLDVVLGHAAHPDPATGLAPVIRQARQLAQDTGRDLAVVVSLTATAGDPQGLGDQARRLAAAGASVHLSNADAARTAARAALAGSPHDGSPHDGSSHEGSSHEGRAS